MRERNRLEQAVGAVRAVESGMEDALALIELGEAEGDAGVVAEAEAELERLRLESRKRELESLLSGEADGNDCYLEEHV